MRVIYKGGSKKLIKNEIYEVEKLYNDGTNLRWLEGSIFINGSKFDVQKFTKEDGSKIDRINYENHKSKISNKFIEFSDLQKGDIIICITDTLKSLAKDKMYIIDKLESEYVNSTPRPYRINYITFTGINKRFIFSNWKFKKLDSDKAREIALESILESKEPDFVTKIPSRKIELSDNINKELICLLAKSILDKNRHKLSVLDWACLQLGTTLSVNQDDYTELLNMKLEDVLKLIN